MRAASSPPSPHARTCFEHTAAGWQRHDLVSARLARVGFGQTLDLRGDRLVVGGPSATPGALAMVFDFDGAAWRETGELVTADVVPGSAYVDVALADDGLVAGAFRLRGARVPRAPRAREQRADARARP